MAGFFLTLIGLFLLYLRQSESQVLAVQGITPLVETGQRIITMPLTTSTNTLYYSVVLAKLTIPLQTYRRPFVTLSSCSNLASDSGRRYHILADIVILSSTVFNIRLDLTSTTSGVRSWTTGSIIKFDYMLISGTFPIAYMSNKLDVIGAGVQSYPKTGGQIDTHSLSKWVGSSPMSLTLPGIRFVWGILYFDSESMNTDSRSALSLLFTIKNSTDFTTTLNSPYNIKIRHFKISLFVYDKTAFDTNKINLRDSVQYVPTFGVNGPPQTFVVNGWINFPGMQVLTGLASYTVTTATHFAFLSKISLTSYTVDLTLYVENLDPSISIPMLEITFMAVSQLTCPNMEPLLDQTQTQCLTTCPLNYNPSISPLGLTGLYVCTPCTTANCCANGYYWTGTACANCALNCSMCSTFSSCIVCSTGYVKDPTGNCILAPPCLLPCILCDTVGCLSCASPFMLGGGSCLCPSGMVLVSGSCAPCSSTLSNCIFCSSTTVCTQCISQFYVNSSNVCSPCGIGCLTCTSPTTCSQCFAFLTLNPTNFSCECPVGFYIDIPLHSCIACTNPYCLNCSSASVCISCATPTTLSFGQCLCPTGQTISASVCTLCSSLFTNCLECNPLACLVCAPTFVPASSGTCVCPSGQILSGTTCTLCSSFIQNCQNCSSTSVCTNCMIGFYSSSPTTCTQCRPECAACTSATVCTQCKPSLILNGFQCVCPSGTYFDGVSTCLACSNPLPGCALCSLSTFCTLCSPTFYQPLGTTSCTACTSNCLNCDDSGCLSCANGFSGIIDSTTSKTTCKDCKLFYGAHCLSCNISQCVTCASGYFWLASSNQCMSMDLIVCNDGIWFEQFEACDDGNTINGDGCNFFCQVEMDYECLLSDKQPSGGSFCRYTKDLSIVFDSLQKQVSSNVIHIFLHILPSTFTQITQETISNLLNPIQIINRQTGVITLIPVKSVKISFRRSGYTNKVQLIIDYGLQNLEGSQLRFNVDPVSTNIPSLKFSTIQSGVLLPILTQKTGVYLYGYPDDFYVTQAMIENVCTGIGMFSLFMGLIGFCVPSGKLIMLEALAVIQITYFSILQYQKIPPTFIGFKNLIVSNGYNDQNLFSSQISETQNTYKLMGLRANALSNQNISLILFVILPSLIGGLGLFIIKFASKADITPLKDKILRANQTKTNENDQKIVLKAKNAQTEDKKLLDESKVQFRIDQTNTSKLHDFETILPKQSPERLLNASDSLNPANTDKNTEQQSKKQENGKLTLRRIIFERIFYENTFYGILMTSYLGWISVFSSFSNLQTPSIVVILLQVGYLIGFGVLFIMSKAERIDLNYVLGRQEMQKNSISGSNLKVLRTFGQINQLGIQKASNPGDPSFKIYTKIALVFLIQRITSSAFLVFLASSVSFIGAIISAIYIGLLGGLIFINKKVTAMEVQRKKKVQQEKEKENAEKVLIQIQDIDKKSQSSSRNKSLGFKLFYQNYPFRQGFNFITIIAIQIIYLAVNITIQNSDTYDTFVNNSMIIKIVPMLVLGLLALNMLFNSFLWIVEVKFDFLLTKFIVSLSSNLPKLETPSVVTKCQTDVQNDMETQSKKEIKSTKETDEEKPEMKQKPQARQKSKMDEKKSQPKKEEDQVVSMLNKFLENSAMLRTKQSPFIGLNEKQVKQEALTGLFRIESSHKVKMSRRGQELRSQLIKDFWDQI